MSSYELEDGTELAKPTERFVHRHAGQGAKDSGEIEISVIERRFDTFISLTATVNDPKWDWVRSDFLAEIVNHRLLEGKWDILSMDGSSATLVWRL